MLLSANINWPQNQGKILPSVFVEVETKDDYFVVNFTVKEPTECFRAEVNQDGRSSWEDSCVEIFLQNPKNPTEYFNFETTSRGFLLAARGPDRYNREKLTQEQINTVIRTRRQPSIVENLVCWSMTVQIPASLFGLDNFKGAELHGNLYKCADKATSPHYLSAFPIKTEKPDFHRPEFFQKF